MESTRDIKASSRKQGHLTDNFMEGAHTALVLRTKLLIARNSIRNIRRHVYLHAFVAISLAAFLLVGGTAMFWKIFDFLMDQPVFGPPLMDRLVSIVFLIFFSMLLFSNLIITLSTTYISKEVEFLMALPLSRQSIFRQKLVESIIYSSWAFALLSLPLFISFGIVRDAPYWYYLLIIPLVVPFLVIPASLGAIFTMVVTSIMPARKTRSLVIVLGLLAVAGTVIMARVTGLRQLLASANQDFLQVMNTLSIGNSPLLPSAWLSNALQSIAPSDSADLSISIFLYWFAMLAATSLFLLEITRWFVPKLYYRGWCLSRDAAVREVESNTKFSPFRFIDRQLERSFLPPTAGLLSKDLKTFWRDPAQWTQLVILFGLMVIYIMNLGWATRYGETLEMVVRDWKTLLSFFNVAATCFILSILTTRFVYPMLSLEGRGFWAVGLAPIPRTKVVRQKYLLCLLLCIGISLPLTALSNYILELDLRFTLLSYGTVAMMSLGLSSLSVGIGAVLPDFKEDNPARIANGIGGTLNVLLSLAYIAVSVSLVALPVVIYGNDSSHGLLAWTWPYLGAAVLFQLIVILVPLKIGLNRWERLEF